MYESQGLFPGYLPFIKEDLNTPDEFFNNENVNEVFIKQLEDETPRAQLHRRLREGAESHD